jgi:hypothetical protein
VWPNHRLVDIPANKHVAVTVRRRDRAVVEAIANHDRDETRVATFSQASEAGGWRLWNATRSRSNPWAMVSPWPRKRSPNQSFFSPTRGERPGHIDGPVGPPGFFSLVPAAFTGKVFTNATASSSHALSALFACAGGST